MAEPEFYVTDHSADLDCRPRIALDELYGLIKAAGFSSVRTDFRWDHLEKTKDSHDKVQAAYYGKALRAMVSAGLKPPTVVLSSVPAFCRDGNVRHFMDRYPLYLQKILGVLESVPEMKVATIQVLNEINSKMFFQPSPEHLDELCSWTRAILGGYNPKIKLMATVFAGNLLSKTGGLFGAGALEYLEKNEAVLRSNFEVIGVDYYPGLLHRIFRRESRFSDMEMLEKVFALLSGWRNVNYELGETGFPTNWPFWKSKLRRERKQRTFFVRFFEALEMMLVRFKSKGLRLPSRIGIYEAVDEDPKGSWGRFLRKYTPYNEHDMGLMMSDGGKKRFMANGYDLPRIMRIIKKVYSS